MTSTSTPLFSRKRSKNKVPGKRFLNHVIIVTGGGGGIGRACANRFASEGAFVYSFDVININDDERTIKNITFLTVDVTKFQEVENAVQSIMNNHAYIDAVVQCAGITGKTGLKAADVDMKDFERVWRINVLGIMHVCKAVIPHMLAANYGRIVNIASISGKEGNPGQVAYASSKGAVIAATKTMAKDYCKSGIIINSIAPAVIKTPMVEAMPDSQVSMMTSKIPMGRCGTLSEISSIIAFMASEENSFSTGFCFDMSGGRATY